MPLLGKISTFTSFGVCVYKYVLCRKRGGYEEERRENDRWNKAERRKVRDGINATLALRRKHSNGQIQLVTRSIIYFQTRISYKWSHFSAACVQ